MKKFLFISEIYPSGLNGGSVKTRGTIQYLLDLGHQVDVLCVDFAILKKKEFKHPNLRIYGIKEPGPRGNFWERAKRRIYFAFGCFFTYKPLIVSKIYNQKIDFAFRGLEAQYDQVFFDGFSTLQYAKKKDRRYIYIDSEDISYLMKKRIKWEKNIFRKIYFWTEFKRSLFFEKTKFSYMNQIWAVSNYGKERFKETSSAKILTIPTLIPQQKKCFTKSAKNLVFVGTLNWRENYLGLRWFIKNCWEEIVKDFPECKLIIAGQQGDSSWQELANNYPNIEFRGFVEDLETLFKESAIAIAPIFINVGIKIKVLTYLSYGMPTISTRIATGGMKSRKGILLVNKKNFAKKVKQLLLDSSLRIFLSKEALENIKTNHSEKAFAPFFKKTKIFD